MRDMVKENVCRWCGELFVKRGNQRYCCKEHSRLSVTQKARLKARMKRMKGKSTSDRVPSVSIQGMLDLMESLSKEKGRVVQYGEVQSMLYTGKIKEKDGVLK